MESALYPFFEESGRDSNNGSESQLSASRRVRQKRAEDVRNEMSRLPGFILRAASIHLVAKERLVVCLDGV